MNKRPVLYVLAGVNGEPLNGLGGDDPRLSEQVLEQLAFGFDDAHDGDLPVGDVR